MLMLPTADGTLAPFAPTGEPIAARAPEHAPVRVAFAAAHVVSDPLAERDPRGGRPAIDWEATLAVRRRLWDRGLGLAEAMDTAQRGMGLDWPTARELIERTLREAACHALRPRVACGAGTDHVDPASLGSVGAIVEAWSHQLGAIESAGGQGIVMATRALPAMGARAEDYARAYDELIGRAERPVILHWLGEAFDPALAGYWGSTDVGEATDTVLSIIEAHAERIDGIKVSLLEARHEIALRARLPAGVRLYTGDDFHYPELIRGDGTHHSDALLGIFAAIAPAASRALDALAGGDPDAYDALMAPTVPLAREVFRAPTRYYKAGIAFLSWLDGAQSHFVMPDGLQSARSIVHYAEVLRLADAARVLADPELACERMGQLLRIHGVDPRVRRPPPASATGARA